VPVFYLTIENIKGFIARRGRRAAPRSVRPVAGLGVSTAEAHPETALGSAALSKSV